MKYFIENKEGEWLKNPDEVMGPGQPNCWTRDPDKAWGFDKTDNASWGEWMFKDTGQWVLYNLRKEDCLVPDTKITEHEFVEETVSEYGTKYTIVKHPEGKQSLIIQGQWIPGFYEQQEKFGEEFRKILIGF